MPQFTVLLFGPAASVIKSDRVVIELPDPSSCEDLKSAIAQLFPDLNAHLDVGRLAVNQAFVAGDAQISSADEIALITMVSGG